MSHYVITGGAGFIGSNLADRLLSHRHDVTIVDNLSRPGSTSNVAWLQSRHGKHLRLVVADVCRNDAAIRAVVDTADVLFHLAAQVAVTTSVTDPRHDFETNALGTLNILEAARLSSSRPVVLYSSTNKVYGKMADLDIVEDSGRYRYSQLRGGVPETRPVDPYSPYGCSKCAGDQYVRDYARIYGLKTVVFRQSCIYGPRQFGMEDQGWIAWFALRAFQKEPVTIYGDGKQVRDVLFVDDLIDAYLSAIRNIEVTSSKAYNIGGGPANTLSLLELVDLLNRRFGGALPCSFEDWRPGDQPVFVSDIEAAAKDFGWRPQVGVPAGLGRLVDWILANQELFTRQRPAAVMVQGAARL